MRVRLLAVVLRPTAACCLAVFALLAGGCSSEPAATDGTAAGAVEDPTADNGDTATVVPDDSAEPTDAAPAVNPANLLAGAEELLASDNLDAAQAALDRAAAEGERLSAEQQEKLTALRQELAAERVAAADRRRAETLVSAQSAMQDGDLEAAVAALETVLASGPTAEEQQSAAELKTTIEDHRRIQRELRSAMKLLASQSRGDVRSARTQLFNQSEVALPLLIKSLESNDPVLVENILETLPMFNQPERTQAAALSVLSRAGQAPSWPAAIRELEKLRLPGVGERLLELAKTAASPEQRAAALTALAVAVDPPAHTLPALLPTIYGDGPDLAAAISAAQHAVAVHHQSDLAARRGLPADLTPEQEQMLDGLGERLAALVAAESDPAAPSAAAAAATRLAAATRALPPQPLTGVTVNRFVGEDPAGPAAAVLDGVWNVTDLGTMWRHPIDKQAEIVLDLGTERIVTGVRIWNYNEASVGYRGWKELQIYVSPTPALLSPAAEGVVAMAPGAAAAVDYSVLIEVPCVRGRYVKLQPRSFWQPNGPSGLAEVQVMGY